jgi:hypothetical protein
MAYIVPDRQIGYIKLFLELPESEIEELISGLRKATPQFNASDLAAEIRGTKLPKEIIEGIIRIPMSLYVTRERTKPVESFLDEDVFPSLKRVGAFSSKDTNAQNEQWMKLRKFLVASLSLERTLGTTAKAGPVLTQHERIFVGARIMTDLRPIYHLDVGEKPDAAIIVHMLKISQRDASGKHLDLYFALDSNDIAAMREVLERALKKEETLKSIVKDSGVIVLQPKPSY